MVVLTFAGNIYRYARWTPMTIGEDGIPNGQAFDYDGETDVLRYPGYISTELFLWENQVR